MRAKRTFLFSVLCMLLAAAPLFAQESEWYYDKRIKRITFSGLRVVSSTDLDGITAQFIGKQFSDDLYIDLLNRIYALDYFDEIDVEITPADEVNSQCNIRFAVTEKPVVSSITFTGNGQVHTTELRDAVTLKKGDVFVNTRLLMDERKIRDAYYAKGFTNVRVSSETASTPNGVAVKFIISEGLATVITNISFQGNSVFSAKSLKSKLSLKEAGFLNKGAFQESSLELDRQTLQQYYLERGYIDAAVTDVVREVTRNEDKNQDELSLTFVIREGQKFTFGGLTIEGNHIFSTNELMSLVTLRPGADFNTTKYQASLMAISDLYYENGYTANAFIPQMERDAETRVISCHLTIVEQKRSHVESVVVRGNTKTKEEVIMREIPIEAGDIFSKTKLLTGLRNLYNTQFFSNIVPDITPGSEENLVDLVINVEEGNTNVIEFGVTFSGVTSPTDFPVSLYAKLSDINLFGTGRTVSTDVTLSNTEQSVGVGYSNAWFMNRPITLSANLSFSHAARTCLQYMYLPTGLNSTDYYMSYTEWSIESSLSLGKRWTRDIGTISLTGGLVTDVINNKYDATLYTPVDSTISANNGAWGVFNSIWGAISFDARDVFYDPSKGWFTSERVTYGGLLPILETDRYLRSDTKLEGYVPLLSLPITDDYTLKLVLAGYTGLSLVHPVNTDTLSYRNTLYIDGMFNGRGWSSVSGLRGKALWSSYLELRSPVVPGILAADFFADAIVLKSTIPDLFTSTKLSDFYFSFGPGLRFTLLQFPLRLLLANTFRVDAGGQVVWNNKWAFTLSLNMPNR